VYLPPGAWFPWSGGASVAGGGTVTAAADVGEIPVYARAGALVVTYPDGVETLTREPALATNAASVGDDRVVYAFAGGTGALTEPPDAGTLSYSLAVAAPGVPTWNSATLAACDPSNTPPCAASAPGVVTVHVLGPGTLAAGGASLACTGGSAARTLTLVVRY
jgi:hypothetical protein